ncbi:E3 SUMO-protein ligase ZBED1-like [Xyrichtys novacula]|uniref:E3 SUMO-protein ligase ZBED1-like n=1 Tax=Xyrichtys novacula TaxID=13765 RepID=A0AAV1G9U1_XYRNO|nr:E3 SUMO-protein ligase ZBED1-like [Xyrichtys novacula]
MKSETRHFADKCAEQFLKVANDWGIENKMFTIGTDSAANMLAAMRALPYEHIACNAHILQRTITVCIDSSGFAGVLAMCRKIVGHFKQSLASITELNQQQVALGKKREQLIQDVPTRWNSTLAMVSRLLRNREAVQATLDQQNNNRLVMPTEAEWGKLQRLEVLLEPCRYVTELLGGEAYVSCSVVLPAFCHLDHLMDITDDDPTYVVKFKNAFQRDLAAWRPVANETWFKVWTSLENMLQAEKPRRAATLQPSTVDDEPAEKKRRSALMLGSDSDSEEDGIEYGKLQRYRAELEYSGIYRPIKISSHHSVFAPPPAQSCSCKFWSKATRREQKTMVVDKVTRVEQQQFHIKAISQGRQGAWMPWEATVQSWTSVGRCRAD